MNRSRTPHLLWGLYAVHSLVSLAYELLWIRHLTLVVGMSLPALGTVLAVFVAGVGLGGYGLSAIARRQRFSTVKAFSALQIRLGVMGIAMPWGIRGFEYLWEALAVAPGGLAHGLTRLAGAALLLLPAAVMGAVFPLLAGLCRSSSGKIPLRGPGVLYFVGLVASGLGALVPLFTIPRVGLTGTSILLGFINLLMGLAAPRIRAVYKALTDPSTVVSNPVAGPAKASPGLPLRTVCGLGGLIGFLIFGIEVIGAHYIRLIVNATPYAEGLVLCVTLLAMAAGSALAVAGLRRGLSPLILTVTGLIGAAVCQILLISASAEIARLFERPLHNNEWVRTSHPRFLMGHAGLAIAVVGVSAAAYGATLPGLLGLAGDRSGSPADSLGRFWAWHNWGALAGALTITFVLIPTIGLTRSLALLAVSGLLASALSAPLITPSRPARLAFTAMGGLGLLIVLWFGLSGDLTFAGAAAGTEQRVLFHHEDGYGIVEVLEERNSGNRFLFSNRLKQEGGTRAEDLLVQRLQGYLPLLLHKHPQRVLHIGLGTGISLGPALRPEVEQLTVVEISRGVLKAAPLFSDAQGGLLSHPKVTLIEDDGRNYLRLTRERYDLIVQDLFFPYQSGVGGLYTLEHFRRCRSRLAPGGMMAQWIAINQVGTEGLRALFRTFQEVFPNTTLWLNGGYLLLLGGTEPLRIHLPDFLSRYGTPDPLGGVAGLASDPFDLLGRFVSTGPALQAWAATGRVNTEETAFIEYDTPKHFATLNTVTLAIRNLRPFTDLHRPLADVIVASRAEEVEKLTRISRASRLLLEGIVARGDGHLEQARQLYEASFRLNPSNYQVRSFLTQGLATRGREAFLTGELARAEQLLRSALILNDHNPDARFDLALARARRGDDESAVTQLRQLLRERPEFPHLRFNLGVSLYRLGRYADAADQFEAVIVTEPDAVDAHFNLANSLAMLHRYDQALLHYERTLFLNPNHLLARENLREVTSRRQARQLSDW